MNLLIPLFDISISIGLVFSKQSHRNNTTILNTMSPLYLPLILVIICVLIIQVTLFALFSVNLASYYLTSSLNYKLPTASAITEYDDNPTDQKRDIQTANYLQDSIGNSLSQELPKSVVSVIDIPNSTWSIAVDSKTKRVYVPNTDSDTMSVIDGKNNSVIGNINLHNSLALVDANPETGIIYVTYEKDFKNSELSIINTKSDIPGIQNVTLHANFQVTDIVFNPTTNKTYIAHGPGHKISVIDGKNNNNVSTIGLLNSSWYLAVNPITNTLYSIDAFNNIVSVIDGYKDEVVKNITVALPDAAGIAVNPTSHKVYVANELANRISVIDERTNNVVYTIVHNSTGDRTKDLVVDNKTNTVYLCTDKGLYVIDGDNDRIVTEFRLGKSLQAVDIDDYALLHNYENR